MKTLISAFIFTTLLSFAPVNLSAQSDPIDVCALIDQLLADVSALNLNGAALEQKLNNAKSKVVNGQNNAAVGQMNAFINSLNNNNDLTQAQIDDFIAQAQAIIDAIISGNFCCACGPSNPTTACDITGWWKSPGYSGSWANNTSNPNSANEPGDYFFDPNNGIAKICDSNSWYQLSFRWTSNPAIFEIKFAETYGHQEWQPVTIESCDSQTLVITLNGDTESLNR